MIRTALVAVAATLLLAGCFGPAPTTPTTPVDGGGDAPPTTVDPATGEVVSGTGYSYNAPEGWTLQTGNFGAGLDTVVADTNDTDGFSDNINVIVSPAGELSSDQIESLGVAELEGVGATGVTVQSRITVAGAESAHLTASMSQQGTDYVIDQYYPTEPGQTYIVTFSFSPNVSQDDRDALAASVLASWQFQ